MKKIFFKTMLITVTLCSLAFCNHEEVHNPVVSKTFVLVHGAWQAPWVWNNVKGQLLKAGHQVVVIELPAHGDDTTKPVNTTLTAYSEKVIETINQLKGSVILAGHSLGGMIISEVAEKIPAKIEKLVYIGAYLPANGQSLLDLANMDKQSILGAALIPSADQLTLDVKQESIISIFCDDAPETLKKEMLQKYRGEPAIPFTNKIVLSDEKFGRVKKYYVHTVLDRAVGIDLQKQMAAGAHVSRSFSVNTSHSPFLAQPDELVKILLKVSTL